MSAKSLFIVFMLSLPVIFSCKRPMVSGYLPTGSVERLSPIMDEIIEPGTLPEIIADSFDWSEGPLWVPELEMVL